MKIPVKLTSREEYLYKFLEIIDCMQPEKNNRTTDLEKRVIISFFTLPDSFNRVTRFSTLARRKALEKLNDEGLKYSQLNLNNKIHDLVKKGLLYREDNMVYAKLFIEKAVENYEKAISVGEHYDFIFRFV